MTLCPNCGAQVHGSRFCTSCGAPVDATAQAAADDGPTTALPQGSTAAAAPTTAAPTTALGPDDADPLPTEGVAREEWVTSVDPAAAPPERRNTALPALLAVLALLLGAGAVVLYLQKQDRVDPVATPPPAVVAPTSVSPSPTLTTASPSASPSPASTTVVPGTSGSPAPTVTSTPLPGTTTTTTAPGSVSPSPTATTSVPSTPFHVVVVASKTQAEGGRAAVEPLLPQIRSAGSSALVLNSADHPSLRCCFWVAAAGPFSSAAEAAAAVPRVRAASPAFSRAYARCVGTPQDCG
ncbi:MAG: zinc ribbon domain-containing protein [Actinomycetota bacterium]|nr:zinc ribbon domain-containing protein [Actinomycetota bacterium]